MNKLKLLKRAALTVSSAYVVGGLGVTAAVFKKAFQPHQTEEYSALAHWSFYQEKFRRRELKIPSGKHVLKGYHYTTKEEREPKGLLVLSHGIWSGPDDYMMVIAWMLEHGWDVVAYSYTSYNGSEGSWAKGLPQAPIDLDAVLTYIEQDPELGRMPKVLMGHSWGAYASCAVLSYPHDVKGVLSLSGFSDPQEISESVASGMFGALSASMNWMINTVDHTLFGKKSELTAVQGINSVDIPVLLVHGENDGFIKFNETSINCHFREITNEKVEYKVLTDPKQSDHNNYFATAESVAYYNQVMKEYEEIKKQYDKKVPEEVRREFFETVDIQRANTPREDFHAELDAFLTGCIEG